MLKINRTIALVLDGLVAASDTNIALVICFTVVTCKRAIYFTYNTNLCRSVVFSTISFMCNTVVTSRGITIFVLWSNLVPLVILEFMASNTGLHFNLFISLSTILASTSTPTKAHRDRMKLIFSIFYQFSKFEQFVFAPLGYLIFDIEQENHLLHHN